MFDCDLFVIGGGSGGVRAARVAARTGARVQVAEEFRFGGTCVIRGCVPKKLLVYASGYAEAFEDAAGFGWDAGPPRFDWARLIAAKDREIARLEAIYARNLELAGCTLHRQRARLVDPHSVRLADGTLVRARHILIATGGTPRLPDVPGADLALTSNEIFDLPALPERAVVLGGGYIACEFAGILHGLGVGVTLVHRGPQILRGFDDDVTAHVAAEMGKKGIDLVLGAQVAAIEGRPGDLAVRLADGTALGAGLVLAATGRAPNTADLGLDQAGVPLTASGAVAVDAWSQTAVPSVYAVGDVTDRLALTPVAIREGQAFADTVFGATPTQADHALVATAVFTQPEIGTIGLSEAAARALGPVRIFRSSFRPLRHTVSGRDERELVKLVVDAATDRVLGVHIVGHGAAEMIQMAAIAVKMGATKADFDRTVAVHPTSAEELVTLRDPV